MADTLPNIQVPSNEWVNLYALSGITVGRAVTLENVGVADILWAEQSAQPGLDLDAYHVLKRGCCELVGTSDYPNGLWAYCKNDGSLVNVQEVSPLQADILSGLYTPFDDLNVAERTPIVQLSGQNGFLSEATETFILGTGADAGANADGQFYATSGTGGGLTYASLYAIRACPYRPGQGFVGTFTATFDDNTGAAGSNLRSGLFNATDGLLIVKQNGEDYIWYQHHGQQEIQQLSYTAGAAGAEAVTVTVAGTPYVVNLTAGSASVAATQTAAQLTGTVPGYVFQEIGASVIVRSLAANPVAGAFTFTPAGGGTAAASFSQIAAGASPTTVTTPRSSWANSAGVTWLDLTKENVYRIRAQYLGVVFFEVQDPETGKFIPFHIIEYPNSNTRPMFAQPAFRIGWTAVNTDSQDSYTVKGGEAATFIPGPVRALTPPGTNVGSITTLDTVNFINLFTFKCSETFKEKVNVGTVRFLDLLPITEATKGAEVWIVQGAAFTSELIYEYHDQENSIVLVSTTNAIYSGGTGTLRAVIPVAKDFEPSAPVDLLRSLRGLVPGQSYSFIMRRRTGGSATLGEGSVSWEEII